MNRQVYDEASEWVIAHRSGEPDGKARRRFDDWLRESPAHVRAYLELSAIWEDAPALDEADELRAQQLIARARTGAEVVQFAESAHLSQTRALPVRPHVHRLLIPLAAMLLASAGASTWFWSQRGVYATGVGEQRTLQLDDGSTIEVNAKSRVRVVYTQHERSIELIEGQALFRVSKDPLRPFVVRSGDAQVRAVGTQFDVYRKSTGTQVTVLEGRVAVAPLALGPLDAAPTGPVSKPEVVLDAGEQVIVAPSGPAAPTAANIASVTAWTDQRLVFDRAPLSDVAAEFNRHNRRQLIIEDVSLEDFHISGSFASGDPGLLLRFLRDQPDIIIDETSGEVRISRRNARG